MYRNLKTTIFLFLIFTGVLAFSQNHSQEMICFTTKNMMPVVSSYQSTHASINETKDFNFIEQSSSKIEIPQHIEKDKCNYLSVNREVYKPGFKRLAEIGYSFGVGDYTIDYIKLSAIYAYKLNPYFSIGIGSGLKYAMQVEDALIPFFVDFRAYADKKSFPFYIAFDLGYSLDVTSDFKTEGFYLLLNPSAGINFNLSDKSMINFGIGYDFQKYKMNDTSYGVIPGTTINTTGISVNAGVSF